MNPEWSRFCVALGLGLLIGLERGRSKGEGPSRRPAGIRTFALSGLAAMTSNALAKIAMAVCVGSRA